MTISDTGANKNVRVAVFSLCLVLVVCQTLEFGLPCCVAGASSRSELQQNAPVTIEATQDPSHSKTLVATSHTVADDVRPPPEPSPEQVAALQEGKALYRGLCSGCHGGSGRGGKGPNLTDDRWLHGDKDEDIARVIQNGVPKTTMKKLGESLKEEQIAKIIGYVRQLGRAPADQSWQPYLAGDAGLGEPIFFDDKSKAQCSKCHSVNKKGGRVGPALDRIAVRRSPAYIMESILQSSKFIDPLYEAVQVVTDEGKVLKGLRVNESNFSIQFREENGRFHSFLKRNLEEFRVLETSLMPDNIAEQLTVKQLHDLFAFLMTLE